MRGQGARAATDLGGQPAGVVISGNPLPPISTLIAFDPDGGAAGSVNLAGIADAAQAGIVVETWP